MDDASAVAVGRMRDELTPYYLLPNPGTLPERLADKAELAGVCASVGIPHPVTLIPDSPAQPPTPPGGWGCRWWRSGAGPGWCRPVPGCAARRW
jgi:hypothetical protein